MLYSFRTTFPLFVVPSVLPGTPDGASVLWMVIKLAQLKPSLGPWSFCSQRCRCLEVSSSCFRIGHTCLTHSHLFDACEALPVCSRCQVCLSISHILVECPIYSVPGNRFYPSLTSMLPCESLSFLLSESPTFSSSILFAFLSVSGLMSDL